MSENETTGTKPGEFDGPAIATPEGYVAFCSCEPKRPLGVPHQPDCGVEPFQLIEDGAAFIREMAHSDLNYMPKEQVLGLALGWWEKAKAIAERLGKVEQVAERRNAEREASRSAPEAQGP